MADDTKPIPTPPPPEQAHPVVPLGYYARIAAAEARRFRRNLTRENLNVFLKQMAWVVPLTLLIWVYAERQGNDEPTNVPIQFEVEQPPGKVVTVVSPAEKIFTCTLSGPRTKIEQILNMPPHAYVLNLDIPDNDPNPVYPITEFEKLAVFKDAGITVKGCQPVKIELSVSPLLTEDATVMLPKDLTSVQHVQTTFNPANVKISAAKGVLDKLRSSGGELTVFANVPADDLTRGQHNDVTVPLRPIEGVKFSRTSVQATLSVEDPDITKTIENVPVLVLTSGSLNGAPGLLDLHRIALDSNTLPSVKLAGPPDEINGMDRTNTVAILYLESTDMKPTGEKAASIAKSPDPGKFDYGLPPGVHVSPDTNLIVKYSTSDRTSGGG